MRLTYRQDRHGEDMKTIAIRLLLAAASLALVAAIPSQPAYAGTGSTSSNSCPWNYGFVYTAGSSAQAYTTGDWSCTEKAVLWDVQWTWNGTFYSSGWMEASGYTKSYSIGRADSGDSYHQIKPYGFGYGQLAHMVLS